MENPANAGPATRVAAALALLVAGAGGVAAPLLHRAPDGPGGWASSLSSFSAGVMLSLALLHLLADAQTLLLGVSPFPLAGLFAGVGILSSLAVDALNSDVSHALDGAPPAAHHAGSDAEEACGDAGGDAPASSILHETAKPHAHAHDAYPLLAAPGAKKLATAHLLEGSILVHSLVIGLNLGAAPGTVTSVSAFAAVLCVHQLFEGASLGSVLAGLGATVPHKRKLVLAGAFAAATPAGVLAGVITKMDVADSPLLAGALNGVSAWVCPSRIFLNVRNFLTRTLHPPPSGGHAAAPQPGHGGDRAGGRHTEGRARRAVWAAPSGRGAHGAARLLGVTGGARTRGVGGAATCSCCFTSKVKQLHVPSFMDSALNECFGCRRACVIDPPVPSSHNAAFAASFLTSRCHAICPHDPSATAHAPLRGEGPSWRRPAPEREGTCVMRNL